MRPQGKTKLGFFPLPREEAVRIRKYLAFPQQCSALDPCVGDGVAFNALLEGTAAQRLGIEIDTHRAEQAKAIGIETLHASTMDVRCPVDSLSLLYLNPPYDLEAGETNNQRLELVFLEHTYRWLKPGGVLVFVIPQPQLRVCARLLAEHFGHLQVFRLTDPACIQFPRWTNPAENTPMAIRSFFRTAGTSYTWPAAGDHAKPPSALGLSMAATRSC